MRLRYHLRNFRIKRKRAETERPLPIIVDSFVLPLILMKHSNTLCLFGKIRLNQQNVFAIISVSKGGVSLLIEELIELANKICKQKAEEQTIELKSAQTGCPKRL